jgi:hypothetical protein
MPSLAFVAASESRSRSIESCVVLTVELRERGSTSNLLALLYCTVFALSRSAGTARCASGAAPISSRFSNETRESMEVVLPRWTFVSMNPDAAELVLLLDERTDAPSSSCKIRPAVTTASGIPVTCLSTAVILTSNAGLVHAEGGAAALLAMRETVIDDDDDDWALCGLSTGTLCHSTSRNDSSAVGSLGCSLRVTTAEYASGSSHTESSRSGLGLWDELKNLKDGVLLSRRSARRSTKRRHRVLLMWCRR